MAVRRPIEGIRIACFARRSTWYWRLVRDHQVRDWGYCKPRDPTHKEATMTEAEAMDEVRRAISGTVVKFPHPLVAREETFLVGERNAEVILSALHAMGWSWVLTRDTLIGPRSAQGTVSKGRGYPPTPGDQP
jgi:hypothetical protein